MFGELYYLLEYRESGIRLLYRPDKPYTLPRKLFVIGTMNTADRSIALVDAAMRRRFAFVELHPDEEPVRGLLQRWLAQDGKDLERALLLEALNARIEDRDFKIGPSYLMKADSERAAALTASRLVAVEAWRGEQYRLVPGVRVGAVRVGSAEQAMEVRVEPKVGIARLLFLLGYAADPGWRTEDVAVDSAEDLLPAVVDALARSAARALGQGVLQGYRMVDDALPLVRGRLLAGAQMSRRFALPLPVEVRYDEYDADIAENQILLAACWVGLGVPRLRADTRTRLLHVVARLDGVRGLVPARRGRTGGRRG